MKKLETKTVIEAWCAIFKFSGVTEFYLVIEFKGKNE